MLTLRRFYQHSLPANNTGEISSDAAENESQLPGSSLQHTVDSDDGFIEPLTNAEALELVEFDPTMESKENWIPPLIFLA